MEKNYQIKGYPRYILVNQNRKIINEKCPRPSSEELYPIILTLLKDK